MPSMPAFRPIPIEEVGKSRVCPPQLMFLLLTGVILINLYTIGMIYTSRIEVYCLFNEIFTAFSAKIFNINNSILF